MVPDRVTDRLLLPVDVTISCPAECCATFPAKRKLRSTVVRPVHAAETPGDPDIYAEAKMKPPFVPFRLMLSGDEPKFESVASGVALCRLMTL